MEAINLVRLGLLSWADAEEYIYSCKVEMEREGSHVFPDIAETDSSCRDESEGLRYCHLLICSLSLSSSLPHPSLVETDTDIDR